ncbi:MAG: ceramidase domain-containing protein [Myxococcales bacterium]|nr:ceramidase domain-containing protein [Myxococcales bacterium]MCB9642900.1 ceramidase domain-containing protein [Myxococcales bacterium]
MLLHPPQVYMGGLGILVGGSAFVVVALPRLAQVWQSWAPATCFPHHCFCEALHFGHILQPSNTWSSLGFVFVGMWIFHRLDVESQAQRVRIRRSYLREELDELGQWRLPLGSPRVLQKTLLSSHWFGFVLGLAVGFVGWFSAIYHATLRFVGQWFDLAAMYLLGTFVLVYALARGGLLTGRGFVLTYIALNSLLGVLQAYFPDARRSLFGVLILMALGAEVWQRKHSYSRIDRSWMVAALVCLVTAFGIWYVDLHKLRCEPHSILQGHAAWHLLCAAAAFFLARYYFSEEYPPHPLVA